MRKRLGNGGAQDDVALELLLALPPDPTALVSDEVLAEMVTTTKTEALHSPRKASRPPRKRWVVPFAVGGAVVLSGAGTTAAYQLHVPPFQTLEPGLERTTVGIPVDYVNYRDRRIHCEAFIEFSSVTPAQRHQINALATDTDWTGYGQRLVEGIPIGDRATLDGEGWALSQALDSDLTARTLRTVPGLAADASPKAPHLTGSSMSCTGPGGRTGAP